VRVRIKICGITNAEDAVAAVGAGADALGFMFTEASSRMISAAAAAKIIRPLPPFVAKVGVFVDPTEEFVRKAIAETGIDTLQFHGEETPAFCARFAPLKVYKAFRVKDAGALEAMSAYQTDAWLLDSYVRGKPGGTGAIFNWEIACQAKEYGQPIILAGGLNPENVAEAIHEAWPYAVDVSSGVESTPGKKDHRLIHDFCAAVRAMDAERF
jgi:phosphoribosylanthranilate isomerase